MGASEPAGGSYNYYPPPAPAPEGGGGGGFHMGRMQRLSATNPLRLQRAVTTLNSRAYTNKFSLFLFLLHLVAAVGLVGFLVFKGVEGLIEAGDAKIKEERLLRYFLPQVVGASFLSITLALLWQKGFRMWPRFMVHFILWSSFIFTLAAGILLICIQRPSTDGLGVVFIFFAIGNGLYSCWVTPRTGFFCDIMIKALEPVPKFGDLNEPTYWMLGAGFVWMLLWVLAVIGAINFYFPPLIIIAMVVSMAWITEVMRNVVNLTVSRVVALYYLRGMQSRTKFCFQRALSNNLGSACLGSLFVPTIEALRIVARGLNLLEGEDEFMFCCARCGLKVMDSIFKRGNGWAYVQIAAYGKSFVKASQDTWELFQMREMEQIVDSDMTSAICFLTGICSGSICAIVVAAWTATVYRNFTATLSFLAAYIGYLLTRIAMAVPQACVGCYYVCYAESPESRLFDKTIHDRIISIKEGHDMVVPTPRVPGRFARQFR
nr:CTL-like protein DDB_G0274487 [Ipomoea batatas]